MTSYKPLGAQYGRLLAFTPTKTAILPLCPSFSARYSISITPDCLESP